MLKCEKKNTGEKMNMAIQSYSRTLTLEIPAPSENMHEVSIILEKLMWGKQKVNITTGTMTF